MVPESAPPSQSPPEERWRPRWWNRLTTIFVFVMGAGLGFWEGIHDGRAEVLAFSGTLLVIGMGLASAGSLFSRK